MGMKNKSEHVISNGNLLEKKMCRKRESCTPQIVVCPPSEEQEDRQTRQSRPQSRRSLDSSSSSDSGGNRSEDHSCSTSDAGSDCPNHRSRKSAGTLKRFFENLTLGNRAQSASPSGRRRECSRPSSVPPKRLLRSPVAYTYVRGPSGLPTQRVPLHLAHLYS